MTEGRSPSDAVAAAAALEQLPAVVWAFSGPDHVAVLANQAAREYQGGSRAYLLGRPLRGSQAAEENREVVALLDEVYRTGRVATYYETVVQGPHGERLVTFTAMPLRDDAGEITGVLTHLTDVTESVLARRTAERELASEQAVLAVLQDALLPRGLPLSPEVRVAARYRSAGTHLDAGGDWYDAVPLAGGRLGASVGDVVGHGPAAAASMGQLRSVLSAALLTGADVDVALRQVGRFVQVMPGARGSTACAVVFDPAAHRVRYACAGHPPPVLVGADGGAEYLPVPPSAPLGLAGAVSPALDVTLAPGQALLLYSDGAVERPGLPSDEGRARLLAACRSAFARGAPTAAELVDGVLAEVAVDAPADDVVLLVLGRPAAAVAPLVLTVPATPDQLARLRRGLRRWLADSGVSDVDALAVQIAIGEATANSVEHAFARTEPGTVVVAAELGSESTITVRVSDTGRWRDPAPETGNRGRGLLLMQQCMDRVDLRRGPTGTEVTLSRRVHGADTVETAAVVPEPQGATVLDVRVARTGRGVRTQLTGDLDTASSPSAALALREACRGGALPLTVDLTRLDHLASAGVRLLFDLAAETAAAGGRMEVVVVQGSAAQHVLELTGFPEVAAVEVLQRREPAAVGPVAGAGIPV